MNAVAVIPAYQAAATVGAVVTASARHVARVVVVDDGSTDGTGAAARAAGATVLTHAENRGKGAALKTAFDDLFGGGVAAVVTIDADGQHVPDDIPRLLDAARAGADLVVGSRRTAFADMCRLRRLSNRVSSWWIARGALDDTQSGFRLYTRDLIERLGFPEPRFEAESAVIVRALRHGLRVVGVPVRMAVADGRGTSHFRPVADSVRIFRAVRRARREPVLPPPAAAPVRS